LYNEYAEAIALAKKILHRFGYSYKKADSTPIDNELPPFRINMARLFELYVYCLLREKYPEKITYQSRGEYGCVDFLKADEKLIIDTKYKLEYKDEYEGENIRQLSGYARDKEVLKKLEIFKDAAKKEVDDNTVVECVIIYPNNDAKENFKKRKLKEESTPIPQFTKFYKCGIKLPTKQG
jgi:5-methylcytosine-specific restriction enzyme subunit McrC